ncbi:hypothetical protein M0R45_028906 [Rubus argutus]|uniref:Uncharacterized protein n=1 Tax=Rubus argutus TaxID=59490 RepID=A0AAW1W8Z0_RUBAR
MDQITYEGEWYREPLGTYTTGPPYLRAWNMDVQRLYRIYSNLSTRVYQKMVRTSPGFDKVMEKVQAGEDKEADKGEEKSGGLIINFIKLVSPRSTKAGEFTKRKVEVEVESGEIVNGKTDQQDVGCGENGGGVISNLISSFFNPSEEDKEAEKVKDIGNKRLKMDEEEDYAAPTTDEASNLIHSLVRDEADLGPLLTDYKKLLMFFSFLTTVTASLRVTPK